MCHFRVSPPSVLNLPPPNRYQVGLEIGRGRGGKVQREKESGWNKINNKKGRVNCDSPPDSQQHAQLWWVLGRHMGHISIMEHLIGFGSYESGQYVCVWLCVYVGISGCLSVTSFSAPVAVSSSISSSVCMELSSCCRITSWNSAIPPLAKPLVRPA